MKKTIKRIGLSSRLPPLPPALKRIIRERLTPASAANRVQKLAMEKCGPYNIPANTSELARDVLFNLCKKGIEIFESDDGPSSLVRKELIEFCNQKNTHIECDIRNPHRLLLIDNVLCEGIDGTEATEAECLPKGEKSEETQKIMPKTLRYFLSHLSQKNSEEVWKWLKEESHATDYMLAALDSVVSRSR